MVYYPTGVKPQKGLHIFVVLKDWPIFVVLAHLTLLALFLFLERTLNDRTLINPVGPYFFPFIFNNMYRPISKNTKVDSLPAFIPVSALRSHHNWNLS